MRYFKFMAGLAFVAGLALPGLSAHVTGCTTSDCDNSAISRTRADIARDRHQLRVDMKRVHLLQANRDRRELRKDNRQLRAELRETGLR